MRWPGVTNYEVRAKIDGARTHYKNKKDNNSNNAFVCYAFIRTECLSAFLMARVCKHALVYECKTHIYLSSTSIGCCYYYYIRHSLSSSASCAAEHKALIHQEYNERTRARNACEQFVNRNRKVFRLVIMHRFDVRMSYMYGQAMGIASGWHFKNKM